MDRMKDSGSFDTGSTPVGRTIKIGIGSSIPIKSGRSQVRLLSGVQFLI